MEVPKKDFRFQNTRCMLTYASHLDKGEIIQFLNEKRETVFCRAAHETGDEHHEYLHTHVLVKFERIFQSRDPRIFDFHEIHPHIDIVRTNTHWEHCLKYIAKEDPENADLKTDTSIVEGIWSNDSVAEALKKVRNLRDILPTIAAFREKPADDEPVDPPAEWRPWQRDTLELLQKPADPRKIIWIFDKEGGAGKSLLTRYIADHMSGICLSQAPGQREVANLLRKFMPINGRIIVFDFARQMQEQHFYEPMEHLKNGMITSTKYDGQVLKWKPGHVVVMANFRPKPNMWTWDRYFVLIPCATGLAGAP